MTSISPARTLALALMALTVATTAHADWGAVNAALLLTDPSDGTGELVEAVAEIQDVDPERPPDGWTPLQFGIYRDIQFPSPWHRLYGIGLGLGTVESYSALGLQAAIGASMTKEQMSGIQLGILGSVSGANANGFQAALVGAVAGNDMNGIQLSGIGAVAEDDMHGIQLGGIGAVTEGNARGIQLSLLAAVSEGDMAFLSFGGIASAVEGTMSGLQGALIAAVAEERMNGLQVGGIVAHSEGGAGGLQVAGIIANSEGTGGGIQAALGLASSGSKYSGIEVGGLAAIGDDLNGAQLALIHSRGHVDGLQVSLLNGQLPVKWSDESVPTANAVHGIQIGGVNTFDEGAGIQAGILNLKQRTRDGDFEGWQLGGLNCAGRTGGLQLGLINTSGSLNGVQLGLLNFEDGKIRFPLVNFRFGKHRDKPAKTPAEPAAP